MAAKTSAADAAALKQLKQDLKAGTLGRLYVFHGEEAYLRDFYLGEMKKALLSGGLEEFNLHTLPAKECDPRALGQVVDCLPMMSQRTMVVVSDYDLFKAPAPDREALAALFDDLPEYVCLVFVYDLIEYKADARTKLAAALCRDAGEGSLAAFVEVAGAAAAVLVALPLLKMVLQLVMGLL